LISRRGVIKGLGALGAAGMVHRALAVERCPPAGLPSRFCLDPAPFPLGVASGDATPSAVILWTRVAENPLDPAAAEMPGDVPVQWIVAADPDLRRIVTRGQVMASAGSGHAVHVDVRSLKPATSYWYRFSVGDRVSRVGRTRTAPEGRVRSLRFAAVSCQDFVAGYGAYASLAREELDFVVHLGDTIYEFGLDGNPATDLGAYRRKHALFRGDPMAREAWAAHPFWVTWDDHEVRSDYWGSDRTLDARRAAGYRAFYEHMPLRLPAGVPRDWKDLRIHRRARFGDLLQLLLLDLRQFRDAPAGDAAAALAPGRSMLGQAQKEWVSQQLSSGARWQCLGSPVLMSDHASNLDAWGGYMHEREQVLRLLLRHGRSRAVVLAGDAHRASVSRLLTSGGQAGFAAMEFGVPALSSKAPAAERPDPDAGFAPAPQAPSLLYADNGYRGYLRCDVDPDAWRGTFRVLRDGGSQCMTTLASFEVAPGGGVASSGFVPFEC